MISLVKFLHRHLGRLRVMDVQVGHALLCEYFEVEDAGQMVVHWPLDALRCSSLYTY